MRDSFSRRHLVTGILALLALGCLTGAVASLVARQSDDHERAILAARGVTARASVVSVAVHTTRSSGSRVSDVCVRFETQAGSVSRCMTISGDPYSEGDSVDVIYDPQDPAIVRVAPLTGSPSQQQLVRAIIFGICGAGLIALVVLAERRRRRNRAPKGQGPQVVS